MPSLFSTLGIGRQALLTNQISLQTIGHNIANVNTPGYTRQRVHISALGAIVTPDGALGTGVDVTAVKNVRDRFLSVQYREENKSFGQWTYKDKVFSQIESLFGEPSENSISNLLNNFTNAWDDLGIDPKDITRRDSLLRDAQQLIDGFHEAAIQLNKITESVNNDLESLVDDVNRLTSELAQLNFQIREQEVTGVSANDLRDQRDYLLDELSSLIDVNTMEDSNKGMIIYIGRTALVDSTDQWDITIQNMIGKNGQLSKELRLGNTSLNLKNTNGKIHGLMEVRDEIIPEYMGKLDELAKTIVDEVNNIHRTGYGLNNTTGIDFFDPLNTRAVNISLNSQITSDPTLIAASSALDAEGNGETAFAIKELMDNDIMLSNTTSIRDYYSSIIGSIGVDVTQAKSFSENFEILTNQIKYQKDSVESVSLDEEMANLIKYQHAYDAAARIITTVDEALDTVINRMGITGR